MIKEKIKQIEDNIREILNEGEDFLNLDKEFKTEISKIKENSQKLENNKIKLLNILLKHSKRKMLFDFEVKGVGTYDKDKIIKVGLNINGLGISSDWENNLKNIEEYFSKKTFKDLLKNKNFVNKFLENINKHLKGQHKPLIKKLILLEMKREIKVIHLGKIIIQIDLERDIEYKNNKDETIKILEKQITKNPLNFHFSFEELERLCNLLEYKPRVISTLKEELKKYKKLNKDIKTKLAEVNKHLSPYEALQQI